MNAPTNQAEQGQLLAQQQAQMERQRADEAVQLAQYQAQQAERMRVRLLALGIDPDA